MTTNEMSTLPPITSSAGTPAQNYIAAAHYFFLGVKALSGGSPELAPACAFLAAQSIECALKSFLSKNGFSEEQLRHWSRRHNLEALWTEASPLGQIFSAQPPMWCVILNQTHNKPFHLRYPIGINGFQTPEVAPMQADLEVLLTRLQALMLA